MKIALVQPSSLLGKELQARWPDHLSGYDLELFSADSDEVGIVTPFGSDPAVVQSIGELNAGAEVVLILGDRWASVSSIPEVHDLLSGRQQARRGVTIIAVTDAPGGLGPVVLPPFSGNLPTTGVPLQLPFASALMSARLLGALGDRCRSFFGCALLGASHFGQAALDEALEQSRTILSFRPQPRQVFDHQVVFNVSSLSALDVPASRQLASLMPTVLRPSLQHLQAGTFHGIGLSAVMELTPQTTREDLLAAWAGSVSVVEPGEDFGVIDIAGERQIRCAFRLESPTLSLWSVADPLVLAADAIFAILEWVASTLGELPAVH